MGHLRIDAYVPAAASLAGATPAKPRTAAEAATQFEGILIAQMLRSAREASGSESEDQTAETMFDIAGQQFSQMLAERGGLGLGKIIAKGLTSSTGAETPPAGPD